MNEQDYVNEAFDRLRSCVLSAPAYTEPRDQGDVLVGELAHELVAGWLATGGINAAAPFELLVTAFVGAIRQLVTEFVEGVDADEFIGSALGLVTAKFVR